MLTRRAPKGGEGSSGDETARSLGDRVKAGYLWTLFGTGLGQPLSFAVGVVLARLLGPADFGIIASCLIFTEVASTVVSSSYVSGLLQRREVSSLDLSTAFVLQLATSAAVCLLLVGLAPYAARLVGNETVAPVLSVLSLDFVLLAFTSIPSVIARRALDFRLQTFVGLVQTGVYGAVSIGMAAAGYGVWSLVGGRLASHLVQAVHLAHATAWRPGVRFSGAAARSLCRISAQFAGKNALDDLARNTDYLIVGWRLGVEALGLYSRAYHLMTFPVSKLSASLGHVLFPAFSKIQDERERLVQGLLKATCLTALATFPALVGLGLVAHLLVPLVYGAKWAPSVGPLQVICLAGLFYAIDAPAVSLINAKGYLADEMKRQVVHLGLLAGGVLAGTRWGTVGVAWGVVLAALVYLALLLALLRRRLGLSVTAYVESLLPAALSCGAMALAVLGARGALLPPEGAAGLAGSVAVGAAAYLLALYAARRVLDRPALRGAFGEIDGLFAAARSRAWKAAAGWCRWQRV